MFYALFSTLLLGAFLVHAAPQGPKELIAFAPTIILPNATSVWFTGLPANVSWETDNIPVEAQSYTLNIMLGFAQNNSENLNITLARNIPIMNGNETITVPSDLPTRHDCIVVLIGDSGDASPEFTMIGLL